MELVHRSAWTVPTRRGYMSPQDPKPEDFDIETIAHKLAMQCRYGGGVVEFYSVAEHCVLLSHLVAPALALVALLHDRAEAYLQDVVRPKKELCKPWYQNIEARLEEVSAPVFGVPYPTPHEVMVADFRICINEKKALFWPACGYVSNNVVEDGEGFPDVTFECLGPRAARHAFIKRYRELRW